MAQPLFLPASVYLADYGVHEIANVRTPALLIYSDVVAHNIAATLRLLNGDANRWRPHVKTVKAQAVMEQFMAHGIHQFKCANSLELLALCQAGAADVMLAYPMVGANAQRIKAIAAQFPNTRVSALVEHPSQIAEWQNSAVSLFIDINPGMNRTGIGQLQLENIVALAQAIVLAGVPFRGLHYYDGHIASGDLDERIPAAHKGYAQLMQLVAGLRAAGVPVDEVTTSGTPAFPAGIAYAPFADAGFVHRITPGTVAFCDCTTFKQLPESYGYLPAAVVVATVVSHPAKNRFTCDAGHKAVSADAGVPTCAVIGHPEFTPAAPSEEHLPVDVADGFALPEIGSAIYLVPRHICPTVNMFDHALLIQNGRAQRVIEITARGRETPL